MSQKDQEAALDEKIERIRRRNEEIERRRKEVEADKLNAEKLNATVKFTPSETKNTDRQPFSRPPAANRNPRFEKKVLDKPYNPKFQPHGKKFANFSDSDGPPPDPVYTFLSDHSRDQPRGDCSPDANTSRENTSGDEFRGQRGRGRGRGWSRGRGSPMRGGRRGGGNSSGQFARQGQQHQPEYQAWRAEREKIDQDRITRQKTAEGNWRREWDSEKLSQDENQEYQGRPSFSKKKKRDVEDCKFEDLKLQRTVTNELAEASSPSKEIESRFSDKSVKSDYHSKGTPGDKKTVAFNFSKGASGNEVNDDDLEEHLEFEHRVISSCGDSIKISLSNKPIKSVKVNPMNAAGTGRVGPRQKPRLSYSSQSEDEKETHAPVFHRRAPPTFSPREAAALPPRVEASSKKPPLPPGRGLSHELGSPKKKPAVTKGQQSFSKKEVESPLAEKTELSRESSRENISEGGDDSWEDVATTSGNESADYSDADVAKKSDSSDRSIPGDYDANGGCRESDIVEVSTNKSEKLDNGNEVRPDEFYGHDHGCHDEYDEEAEENYEAVEDDGDVLVAAPKGHEESSLQIDGELCGERIGSIRKEKVPHEEEVASVTEERNESQGEGDHRVVEEQQYRDEGSAAGDVLSATMETTLDTPSKLEENADANAFGDPVVSLKEPGAKEGEKTDSVNDLPFEGRTDLSP